MAADYKPIHQVADRLEPPLRESVMTSTATMRESISINALANALAAGDVKRAVALLSDDVVGKSLQRSSTLVREAVAAGGRLGAAQVAKALK